MDAEDITCLLHFLEQAENLKNTLRSAYSSTGRRESSAEHSWRLCLMLVLLEPECEGMDRLRLLQMAVIHDLAEAVCGDIPAVDATPEHAKARMESEAMQRLTAALPEEHGLRLRTLWEDYERGESREARFLKGLDKLETILQHNQGRNPADFDYAFNLDYGRDRTDAHPLLRALRRPLDAKTARNAAKHDVSMFKNAETL